jgi:hypothetical protein
MVSHFMALSLAQAEVVSHGVEVVVEFLVAGEGEGSVGGGSDAWGNYDGKRGSISTTG